MSLITNIKNQIKIKLDALVTAHTLGEVQVDDFKNGLFDRDYGKFPVAIVTTPSVEGSYLTNCQNERLYTYEIIVIQKGENVTSPTETEELIESLLDAFDNDPTLNGKADGGVEPSSSTPQAVSSRDKTYIAFSIILKAKAVKDLIY